jgi:hypothetical protein
MMKYLLTVLALSLSLAALANDDASPSVTLAYGDVETFRDFEYAGRSEKKTAPTFTRELTQFFSRVAPRYLSDHTLEITFTDIDLAGEIQPWRSLSNPDIRFVKSIYPPRAEFSYVLRGPDGEIAAQGDTKLVDLAFNFGVHARASSEPFYYEQEMLREWLREDISPLVKTPGDSSQ